MTHRAAAFLSQSGAAFVAVGAEIWVFGHGGSSVLGHDSKKRDIAIRNDTKAHPPCMSHVAIIKRIGLTIMGFRAFHSEAVGLVAAAKR